MFIKLSLCLIPSIVTLMRCYIYNFFRFFNFYLLINTKFHDAGIGQVYHSERLFTHSLQAAHQAETPAPKGSILHGLIISSLIINNYNNNSKQNKHYCLEQ